MSTSPPRLNLLADECVYAATVRFLQRQGHDVVTVQELGLSAMSDTVVISKAVALRRVLLTRDMDFSNIVLYPPAKYLGIVVLKMTPQTTEDVHRVLDAALANVAELARTLLIVDHGKYRLRK